MKKGFALILCSAMLLTNAVSFEKAYAADAQTTIYTETLDASIDGKDETVTALIKGDQSNPPMGIIDSVYSWMIKNGIPNYYQYNNAVLTITQNDLYASSSPLVAAVSLADGQVYLFDGYQDENTGEWVITRYSPEIISFDFSDHKAEPKVLEVYHHWYSETGEPSPVETDYSSYVADESEEQASGTSADTTQSAQQTQPVEEVTLNQDGINFINKYVAGSDGILYSSVTDSNYRQIMNGYGTWKELSNDQQTAVNEYLKAQVNTTYENMFIAANRKRLEIAVSQLSAPIKTESPNTAASE